MSKFSPRGLFGRRSGTVNVLEDRVRRSSARTAKLTFYLATAIVGLLAAAVASDHMHPILALFLGALIGAGSGAVAWVLVTIWPILRVLWWWATEIAVGGLGLYVWIVLGSYLTLPYRLIALVLVVGIPAGVPWIRHRIVALAWCVISRHRLRVCFSQFIITNRSGSLPFILWARPTSVGERIWVWLRPGLSVFDIESRLEKIAVACWADTVTVAKASASNAAFICLDIKRRNALSGTVSSPLTRLVAPFAPPRQRKPATAPTALDLADISAEHINPSASTLRDVKDTSTKPLRPAPAPTKPVVSGPGGDDISDYLD